MSTGAEYKIESPVEKGAFLESDAIKDLHFNLMEVHNLNIEDPYRKRKSNFGDGVAAEIL